MYCFDGLGGEGVGFVMKRENCSALSLLSKLNLNPTKNEHY